MTGELNRSEINEVLSNGYIGRIGCRDGERIYIVPVNYVYENGVIYCQSYEGMKVLLMRQSPGVCFEVEELRSFSSWRTVIAWGNFEELTTEEEIRSAHSRLSEVMLAQKAVLNQPPPAETADTHPRPQASITYYRIRLDELSGRFEREI